MKTEQCERCLRSVQIRAFNVNISVLKASTAKNEVPNVQGRREHLKLGGAQHFEGTFFLRKRGHFLR